MGTAKGDGYTVTPRDLELVINAINCTRLPFELDYDKLARRLGYKNAQSAKAAWNALKKKLDKVAEGAPVVPSLTIEPEPLRLPLGSASSSKDAADPLSAKKKGKQPARERDAASETSGDESMGSPVRKSKKMKSKSMPSKQVRSVDDDGDVSMGEEDPRLAKTSKRKSSKKISDGGSSKRKDADTRVKKRRRVAVETSSSYSSIASSSSSESEDAPAQGPRKKLKRKSTNLAMKDRPGQGGEKSGSPFAGKLDKAFRGYGRRGAAAAAGGGGEDDEEALPDPPPAYVRRESDIGGEL